MKLIDSIKSKINSAINVQNMIVQDDTDSHSEHGVFMKPSHVNIYICSESFVGKGQLQRHRLINEIIKDEISKLHAISLKLVTPEEANR